jgi:tetratricopeptide (TPR) repeat protein
MRRPLAPLLLLLPYCLCGAQGSFTTQTLVVPAFEGADRGLAHKAGDVIRSRLGGAFSRNELKVVSGREVDRWLQLSGIDGDIVLSEGELAELAKKFRVDERVTGRVRADSGGVRVDATLTLVRDLHLFQPVVGRGATVTDAANAAATELIAARHQLGPLRDCENLLREGKTEDAARAAAAGVAAYARAVPVRLCLLNSLRLAGAAPDSIIAVGKAVLDQAPTNPAALGDAAAALDERGDHESAGRLWLRLYATDSTNDDLLQRVVDGLAGGSNAKLAQPLIDSGSNRHPDNLYLIKQRWLVHLATSDWKGAIEAGELLALKDPATRNDPDFYSRLSSAYRMDSQPTRALGTVATGAGKFPDNVPLYITYLQLLHAENDVALHRGLLTFPENPELHALAAVRLRTSGDTAGAIAELRRALEANPRLVHGYLQLAQLDLAVGNSDSAFAALSNAVQNGETPSTVAQFALARGHDIYMTATTTNRREDFERSMKFISLAADLAPSAEASFLLGASGLNVSIAASREAPATRSCTLSKLASSLLPEAENNLRSSGPVASDAVKQYLEYAAKLKPYVEQQVREYCS